MKKILLTLDLEGLPPTVNHLYRSASGGRRYKTAEGRYYQEKASAKIATAWGSVTPAYTQCVELRIEFETNSRRKWDIDNRVKAVQDCLQMAGVLKDDSQIVTLHVEKHEGRQDRTRITLLEMMQ